MIEKVVGGLLIAFLTSLLCVAYITGIVVCLEFLVYILFDMRLNELLK